MAPPGAVGGREPPVIPFHGHIGPAGCDDRVSAAVVERRRQCGIESAVLPLPLRPHPVDVAVKQEEQRDSFCGGRGCWNRTAEAGMAVSVRIDFQGPECGILVPSASVCASVRRPGGAVAVLNKGRRLIPATPSVFQNCNGLVALKPTVPS